MTTASAIAATRDKAWATGATRTADATASARRVEEPERVCARCRVAADIPADGARQTVIAMQLLPFGDAKTAAGIALVALDEARARIEAACLAAHHARDDAALANEALEWTHVETDDAEMRELFDTLRRLAARLEGGKR